MTSDNFANLFLEIHPELNTVVSYVRKAIGKEDVTLADLTRVNMTKINDTILANVSNGAAKTYFAHIKSFVNLYREDIPASDSTKKLLHAKTQPSQNVYLSEKEIASLEEYLDILEARPKKRRTDSCEIDVLHAFLAECYCGARGCDVAEFTDENFQGNYLSYVSKKTKVLSQIPVHKNLRKHLDHVPKKEYFEAVRNRVIKRVCEVCGFNEPKTLFYRGKLVTGPKSFFVGFHTARRSFATNLHLRNVPLAVIAQFMNHGNDLQMTQRYIVADISSVDDNALAFFN